MTTLTDQITDPRETDALTWVIVAAAHRALTEDQAAEVARAILAAGWVFRP